MHVGIAVGGVVIAGAAVLHYSGVFQSTERAPKTEVVETRVEEPEARRKTPAIAPDSLGFDLVSGAAGSTDGNRCTAVEYAGTGPDVQSLDPTIWNRFVADYQKVKGDLIAWLQRHSAQFSPEDFARMESEMRETRVMRPQAQIEPDLLVRGVATWSRPAEGTVMEGKRPALIQVSDGFLKLYLKDKKRAHFEIARALSHVWSSCELGRGKPFAAWKEYLGCMGLNDEQQECQPGKISESAWASSTALASFVANPGCEIPAFQGDEPQRCLRLLNPDGASGSTETGSRATASERSKETS
jgi:hypothetical protein